MWFVFVKVLKCSINGGLYRVCVCAIIIIIIRLRGQFQWVMMLWEDGSRTGDHYSCCWSALFRTMIEKANHCVNSYFCPQCPSSWLRGNFGKIFKERIVTETSIPFMCIYVVQCKELHRQIKVNISHFKNSKQMSLWNTTHDILKVVQLALFFFGSLFSCWISSE